MAGDNTTDIENKANRIVTDVVQTHDSQGMRTLIHDIQDMQSNSRDSFPAIMRSANQKLDAAAPQFFGSVDIVGVDNGALVLKNTKTNETFGITPDGQMTIPGARHLSNRDGSSLDLARQADGKEHPVRVTHPDGQMSIYTYDANGPKSVTELSPQGQLQARYERGNGGWNKAAGAGPDMIPGSLTVTDDGTHRFRLPDGTITERHADGSTLVKNPGGQVVAHTDAVAARAQGGSHSPFTMGDGGAKK